MDAPSRSTPGADRTLRVALLHPTYWPEVTRGSERIISDHARALARLGDRPHLITSHPAPPTMEVVDGVTIERLRRPSERIVRRLGIHEPVTHLPRSWKALRRDPPDVVHAFHPTEGLAALGQRGPLILSAMGILRPERLRERRQSAALWRWAARRADAVVALSAAAARSLEPLGVHARVIHPGVDIERFRPTCERARRPTIFCPADPFDPRKRVQLLVDAVDAVRARRPDLRLVLAGYGAGKPPSWASRDFIEWRTYAAVGDDLADSYSSSWVTVLPSRHEAFGLVLTEALACGTPVVGTREGGIPEIVKGPLAGELFEPDDHDALVTALVRSLARDDDPGDRSGRREIARNFSTDAAAQAHETLYRQVIADRNGSGVKGLR